MAKENIEQGSSYCGKLRVRARKRERSIVVIKVLIAPPVADKKHFRRLLSRVVEVCPMADVRGHRGEARLIGR